MRRGRRGINGQALSAVALSLALATAGCSSGSKSDSSTKKDTDAASSTTGTAAATTATTTTEPSLPSSAQTISATLTAKDADGDWRTYPGKPVGGTGSPSKCASADPKGVGEKAMAGSQGEILQKAKLDRYGQTVTTQFPDAATAETFAQLRLSDAWIECQRTLTEQGLTKDPKQTVTVNSLERTKGDGAFRGTYGFLFNQEIDGKQQFGGAYSYHWIYRKGSIVVDAFIQVIGRQTDAKGLDDRVHDELVAGMDKVIARIAA